MTRQNSVSAESGGMHGSWRYPVPPAPPPPMYPTPVPWSNDPRYGGAVGVRPSTHLALSIVALLFSFVFGVLGLYFTSQVTQRWNIGDVVGARKASKTALVLDIIGIVLGTIVAVVVVLVPDLAVS